MKLSIGEKIALLRRERNATQTELAEYLFVTPQTVSRWEVGGGAPEITLLPKIAAFFGVSVDELFGLTSLERAEDLVCKYSVLRDDRSFREAMDYVEAQLHTLDALEQNGSAPGGLEQERDQLKAEKLHLWIQQGREAFRRALALAEGFVQKTEGRPEHPWYLPMRLQRDQLLGCAGRGREALAERERAFSARPDGISLLRYLAVLDDRQDYEGILSLAEAGGPAEALLFPPAGENLSAWARIIRAAAETGDTDFIERRLPPVLAVCAPRDEADFLTLLLDVYRGERLAEIKGRLRALLPGLPMNGYFKEKLRARVEE